MQKSISVFKLFGIVSQVFEKPEFFQRLEEDEWRGIIIRAQLSKGTCNIVILAWEVRAVSVRYGGISAINISGLEYFEEAKALLGRNEYCKGDIEVEGIDIALVNPKIKLTLTRACQHCWIYAYRSCQLSSESIFLKAK
ncbi:PREDICTED: uncharacterized protein LOC101297658 [Fragaria vesca subsp. vesca]